MLGVCLRCWPQLKQLEAGKGPRMPSSGSAEGSGRGAGGSGSGSAAAAHGSGSTGGSPAVIHKALLLLLPTALKEHRVMSLRALRQFLRDDSRATAAASSAEAPDSELLVRHPPLCAISRGCSNVASSLGFCARYLATNLAPHHTRIPRRGTFQISAHNPPAPSTNRGGLMCRLRLTVRSSSPR